MGSKSSTRMDPQTSAGSLPGLRIRLLVAAVLAVSLVGTSLAAGGATVPKPRIVWKPIVFGAKRKAETAAYAKRHYGTAQWRLVHPHVIVEHYTASSFGSAYATFASDSPDSELHELPGTCAHFIVDTDGTVYQLVNLSTAAATRSGSTGPRSGSSTSATRTRTSCTTHASSPPP